LILVPDAFREHIKVLPYPGDRLGRRHRRPWPSRVEAIEHVMAALLRLRAVESRETLLASLGQVTSGEAFAAWLDGWSNKAPFPAVGRKNCDG
jgi:hypothetical protein